ncbi:MAG: PQQ-like beta-propeller repeat protein [Verrucomicrobia subdivision 3 bacterium]|nr:PQQ-like beta-propeller repeat protein [Limisphaerales bacterium]
MKTSLLLSAALLGSALTSTAADFQKAKAANWHHWRGPDATGASTTAQPPVTWSEDKNIQWKIPIPGYGSATPIIWGNKVFILTAVNTEQVDPNRPKPEDQPKRIFGITHPNTTYEYVVLCLDRQTGKTLWRQVATRRVPHEGAHGDNNFASASPTTDGERLYCWFSSAGLFCFDLDGKKLWERDLGQATMGASLGEGCSPVIHDGRLVIVRDHVRQSSIEVLNAANGKTLWKEDRQTGNGWATPAVVQHGDRTQIITTASGKGRGGRLVEPGKVVSYNLANGQILWQCSGLTDNAIPCPVVANGIVYCMTGYQGFSLLALPITARGDLTGTDKVLWNKQRGTPYIPSPLLYNGLLHYTQSNQALLTCTDARTGETYIDRERLNGLSNVYSSPVAGGGRVYLTARNGATLVLQHGKKLEPLATNRLNDRLDASPALAGKQLFLRGRQFLYCIAKK